MNIREVSEADVRRWRQHLADERANIRVLQDLARRREGEERDILIALARAESRHARHWEALLGDRAQPFPSPTVWHRIHGWFARRFGLLFVLALMQRSKADNPYTKELDAPEAMRADEALHEEVLRGLSARGRRELTGNFRAAVFGANDGLVSNLALVMGMAATGVGAEVVLAAGLAGLLAGALSMGAGEYISVRSARELLAASQPGPHAHRALHEVDLGVNELELVYRARGMDAPAAKARAAEVLGQIAQLGSVPQDAVPSVEAGVDEDEAVGNPWGAAISSFCFFGTGALIPVLPYLVGLTGTTALLLAAILVGAALLLTGGVVGVLSGASPGLRGLRQLLIGYAAAGATYLLGLVFGTSVS